ncbi:MAG: glycosyltransferase [Chloroflexota bacterium]
MRVVLVTKPGHSDSGVGRYTQTLETALRQQGHEVVVIHPQIPLPDSWLAACRSRFGIDLTAFLNNYPIWVRYPKADVYHISSQNLATLLLWRRPRGKVVLTVHDIIPWMTRNDPEIGVYNHAIERFFDWLALQGIRRADRVLTDSDYTQQTLARELGTAVPPMKTVLLGVD